MSSSYSVFLRRPASDTLATLREPRKSAISKFIDYLGDNPFDEGDFPEQDEIGRTVYCKIIRDYAITYYPDHPVKEVKILELLQTP
jgi:mRNA-degrading endonuclease RelE of RelBE toxin-antitoxin system